jgi:hypothetical protein
MEKKESFKKYILTLEESAKKEIGASWNKHRQLIMRDDRKNKQILLREIIRNNCNV